MAITANTCRVPGGANRIRAQLSKVKAILSNVRWNYFPWTNCEVIPVDDEPTQPPEGKME
jgi:hypothetical protein